MFKKFKYIYLILLFLCGCSDKPPAAEKGGLDLTTWDFIKDGPVNLNGEWEFYWNKLYSPDDFDTLKIIPDEYIQIPSVWDRSNGFKGMGCATYRLQIKNNIVNKLCAVTIGEVLTAYRLWANGEELFSAGTVGADEPGSKPQFKSSLSPFAVDSGDIELVIQVSNFHYKDGGIKDAVKFGLERQLTESRERTFLFDYFLFGSVLVMGLYHLVLAFLESFKQTTLLFALFCLIVASRVLFTNEHYITYLIPDFNWELHIKIIVLGYYTGFIVFIRFIYQLYSEEFSRTILKIIHIVGGILSLVVAVTPASIYSYTEFYFQIMVLLGIVYTLFVLAKAIKNKRNGALLLLTGFIALSVVTTNDILYAQYISPFQNLLPLGLFIFILLQSYILAKHFSSAVTLSEELAISNQKLFESNESKDKFFSIIAHDLKGPIGSIANLLNYSEAEDIDSESLELLQAASQNTFELVQDLLSWAQAQKGQIELEPTNFSILQIFNKVIFALQMTAQQKDIRIVIANKQNDLFAYGDIPTINTVIRNLVSNAIKFTNAGGSITLSATAENDNLRVAVSDTGVGMKSEKLSRLFEIGASNTSVGTNNELGTGLGLLLCKEFVELNKGNISVESTINIGTTFSFTLPQGTRIDQGSILESIKAIHLEALIVEDNYLNLQSTINEISKAGIKYDTAKEGKEAIAKGCKREYNFILMDIDLPERNGIEASWSIRMMYPKAVIIALSSFNKAEIELKDKKIQFNGFLKKPMDLDNLLNILNKLFIEPDK